MAFSTSDADDISSTFAVPVSDHDCATRVFSKSLRWAASPSCTSFDFFRPSALATFDPCVAYARGSGFTPLPAVFFAVAIVPTIMPSLVLIGELGVNGAEVCVRPGVHHHHLERVVSPSMNSTPAATNSMNAP